MSYPRQRNDARIDAMAELVANGMTVAEAGKALNLTKGQTSNTWNRIKADCGWRAQ